MITLHMDLAENILYESNWSLKAQKLLSFVLNFNLYKYFDTKKKVNTKKVLFKIIYPSTLHFDRLPGVCCMVTHMEESILLSNSRKRRIR